MDYPLWPETLPCPRRDGFSVSGTPPTRRVEMESGPARVQRISSRAVVTNSYSITCGQIDAAEFWSFYHTEANAGADWVLMPMVTGNRLLPHKSRFVDYPEMRPEGLGRWRISFTLETAEHRSDWSE